MSASQARHSEVLREAEELFAMKNASYRDSWRKQGWRGNVSRILEKAQRLRSLLWRPSVLLNGSKEHPRETLLDVINTCVFAIINMDDGVEWGEGVDDRPLEQRPKIMPGAMHYPVNAEPEGANETTRTDLPLVGDVPVPLGELLAAHEMPVPTPGEEKLERPSPKPRAVTDRGSGPRKNAGRK